eukprot:3142531-Alexandrium_andersonii.AAC.1
MLEALGEALKKEVAKGDEGLKDRSAVRARVATAGALPSQLQGPACDARPAKPCINSQPCGLAAHAAWPARGFQCGVSAWAMRPTQCGPVSYTHLRAHETSAHL